MNYNIKICATPVDLIQHVFYDIVEKSDRNCYGQGSVYRNAEALEYIRQVICHERHYHLLSSYMVKTICNFVQMSESIYEKRESHNNGVPDEYVLDSIGQLIYGFLRA